jgi:hypothetical protein
MKRLVLFTAVLLSFASSFAQRISFTDTTNVWSTIDSNIGCCIPIPTKWTKSYYDTTSFIFNGKSYRYLYTSIATVPVRESAGRVYVLQISDSVERLMYDFNLNLHDTLRTNNTLDKFTAWVSNIDSTQIAGQWYKVWHFDGIDSVLYYPDSGRALCYNVIEGIGCTNGPSYPVAPYSLVSFSQQLQCFKSDLIATSAPLSKPVVAYGFNYFSNYDNDSSCAAFNAVHSITVIGNDEVNKVSSQSGTAKVVPNPANQSSRIILPGKFISGTVSIVNVTGQLVATISVQDKDEVIVGDRITIPGIYFYKVTDNTNGNTYSGRFVY